MYNGVEYYYVKNLQGDIISLIDASGAWVVEYRYDAWVRLLAVTGTMASTLGQENPLRYRGYYYDVETGLYYVSSRYYSPEICRFISPDNESVFFKNFENFGQYNLYTYCWNNPVNMVDIMGYWPEWIEKAATLGAAAIATVGAVAVTVVAFGAASVAGVVAITAALTVAARTTEVAILQARKSSSENKNGGEIAIDVVEAIYDNGQDIVGKLPYTKSAGVGFNYTKNQVNAVIKIRQEVVCLVR